MTRKTVSRFNIFQIQPTNQTTKQFVLRVLSCHCLCMFLGCAKTREHLQQCEVTSTMTICCSHFQDIHVLPPAAVVLAGGGCCQLHQLRNTCCDNHYCQGNNTVCNWLLCCAFWALCMYFVCFPRSVCHKASPWPADQPWSTRPATNCEGCVFMLSAVFFFFCETR